MCHVIGVRLGKSVGEVMEMPQAELIGWMAFFELEGEEAKNRGHA